MGNLLELSQILPGGPGDYPAPLSPVARSGLDARFRTRRDWLARTERDLAAARLIAEAPGCPKYGPLCRHLQSMLDAAADAECLTSVDRERLAAAARSLARTAYQRGCEGVLAKAHDVARGDAEGRLGPLRFEAEQLLLKLKRLQLDEGALRALRDQLARLRETRRREETGKAKQPAETKPVLREQRLFKRYRQPVLQVQIGNRRYRTLNWSLGGFLLGEVAACPAPAGSLLAVAFWIEGGRRYEEQATIARTEAAGGCLALKMRRFGSGLVTLKQECEQRGRAPRP